MLFLAPDNSDENSFLRSSAQKLFEGRLANILFVFYNKHGCSPFSDKEFEKHVNKYSPR